MELCYYGTPPPPLLSTHPTNTNPLRYFSVGVDQQHRGEMDEIGRPRDGTNCRKSPPQQIVGYKLGRNSPFLEAGEEPQERSSTGSGCCLDRYHGHGI